MTKRPIPAQLLRHPPRVGLSAKQKAFIQEYLIDLNAAAAARRAGYHTKHADVQGCMMLRNPKISVALADAKRRQLASKELSAGRVLEELRRVAFVDARGFWDGNNLKPMGELTEEQGAALSGFEAIIKNAAAGDRHTDLVHKIKLWDKVRALEALAKHFRLLDEHIHVEDWDKIAAGLAAARKRSEPG